MRFSRIVVATVLVLSTHHYRHHCHLRLAEQRKHFARLVNDSIVCQWSTKKTVVSAWTIGSDVEIPVCRGLTLRV